MQATRTFKLFFAAEDIRRITLDNVTTFEAFHEQLLALYPNTYHPELLIRYKDEEDDLISITCQREWEAMLDATRDQGTVRLLISEGRNAGKYFKDGTVTTQAVYVENEGGAKVPVEEQKMRTLQIQLPQCLARLFPGGRILPSSIPSWLEGCVEIKRVEADDPTLDLDIDVTKLFDKLHEEALARIGADKERSVLEKAKEFLQSMIALVPTHPTANYNLACVESLLGDIKGSAAALRVAIVGGFTNLQHMLQDVDLKNLRETADFQDIVRMLTGGKSEEKQSEKQPEEVEMVEIVEQPAPAVVVVPVQPQPEPVQESKPVPQPQPEPVVPAPSPSPAPVPSTPATAYPVQQAQLVAMGFGNAALNERHLTHRRGDISRVINDLLQ